MKRKCACGCGYLTKPRNKYIHGHHTKMRTGWHHTEESKRKISEKAKGRVSPRKGKNLSEEIKQKIGEAHKGKELSEEHKRKIKRTTTETYKDPTIRLKCGRKGRRISEEQKQRIKEYMISAWQDSEFVEKLTGENANNWKGGLSFEPYSAEFNNSLRKEIKNRDNHICQNPNCPKISSYLAVHHIDYNKSNCDKINLITLCQSCNSVANFNRNYWMEFYSKIMKEKYETNKENQKVS